MNSHTVHFRATYDNRATAAVRLYVPRIPNAGAQHVVQSSTSKRLDMTLSADVGVVEVAPGERFSLNASVKLSTDRSDSDVLEIAECAQFLRDTPFTHIGPLLTILSDAISAAAPPGRGQLLALYDAIVTRMKYRWPLTERGAELSWSRSAGDCMEYAGVFVAVARRLGYPARVAVGTLVPGEAPHVWAQVHLDGTWRSVDPSLESLERASPLRRLIAHLPSSFSIGRGTERSYFDFVSSDRVAFSLDEEIEVGPAGGYGNGGPVIRFGGIALRWGAGLVQGRFVPYLQPFYPVFGTVPSAVQGRWSTNGGIAPRTAYAARLVRGTAIAVLAALGIANVMPFVVVKQPLIAYVTTTAFLTALAASSCRIAIRSFDAFDTLVAAGGISMLIAAFMTRLWHA